MTQQAIATPSPTQNTAPQTEAPRPTAYDRAEALKAKLESEPANDNGTPSIGADPAQPSEPERPETDTTQAAPPTQDADAEKRRTERQARLAQVRAKEEAANRARQERQRSKVSEGEIEKLRKRVADLEPLEQAWSSPLSMLEWAEKKGHKPEDVVKVLKEKLTDPAAVAQRQAQTIEQRFAEELRKRDEKIAEMERRWAEERTQANERTAGERRAAEFRARVTEKTGDYPLTAAFSTKHGYENLVAFANRWVAQDLPEEYSLEQLHDHLEQVLEELQVAGALPATPPTTEPVPQAHSGGAGQPTTTLNNRTTAGRGVVAEEVPLARLPKADRIRRLRDKLDRE